MMKSFVATLALLLLQISFAQAQDSTYRYWITFGLGIDNSSFANIGGSYNGHYQNMAFQVGYQLISRDLGLPNPEVQDKELPLRSVNIGIGQATEHAYVSFANFIGPAYVWGDELDKSSLDVNGRNITRRFHTVGVALNSQIFFRPLPDLGVGLELYGNVNPIRTMAEVRLSLQIGNFEK